MASLAVGFECAARHLSLVLLPLLLDLFLWLGPRLSLATLIERLLALWQTMLPADSFALLAETMQDVGARSNLFSLLSPAPLLGLPSLHALHLAAATPWGPRVAIEVSSPLPLIGWIAVLLVAGSGLNALYLAQVGRAFRAEQDEPLPSQPSTATIWRRLLALIAFLVAVILFVLFPLLSLVGFLSLLSTTLAFLVESFLLFSFLFALLRLIYLFPAIVLMNATFLQALRESLTLTQLYLNQTAMLVTTMAIIEMGLNFVWTLPPATSWVRLVSLAGHAFIDTALLASLFYFYHQRLAYLASLKRHYQAQAIHSQVKPS